MSAQKQNLASKITFKGVCGSPEMVPVITKDENDKEKTVLRGVKKPYMRVLGIAKDYTVKTTDYGDSIEFKGDFKAIELSTGEMTSAAKCFLPKIAEDYLFTVMSNNPDSAVEFAFDLGIKPAASTTGYEYTVTPLIDSGKSDPLEALAASLPALPQLAAPEKEGDKTEPEKPAKTAK